jgi:hypothetical protein
LKGTYSLKVSIKPLIGKEGGNSVKKEREREREREIKYMSLKVTILEGQLHREGGKSLKGERG